jgi:hypothetical protein
MALCRRELQDMKREAEVYLSGYLLR